MKVPLNKIKASGLILLFMLFPSIVFGQYHTKWLQEDLFNSVTLSIVDILKNRGTQKYHPLIENDSASGPQYQKPIEKSSSISIKIDSLLLNSMTQISRTKADDWKYGIYITKIDTVKYQLEFTLRFHSKINVKLDTEYSVFINYNNYNLFVAFKDSSDETFLSLLPNSKLITGTFIQDNGFDRSDYLYCGDYFYYFYSVNESGIKLNKYYDYDLIPRRLKRKTIEYNHIETDEE